MSMTTYADLVRAWHIAGEVCPSAWSLVLPSWIRQC